MRPIWMIATIAALICCELGLCQTSRAEKPILGMTTQWGQEVTPDNAWQEYPRPQFRRESWVNLNGLWNYAVTDQASETMPQQPDGEILVPFAIESKLSGVGRLLEPNEKLWYRRVIRHQTPSGHRTQLRFEAVDYKTEVFINGRVVGSHIGSSDHFAFDITDHLTGGDDELVVAVIDETGQWQTLGKQTRRPKGIYYTRVSGIWQTVWLEDVPDRFIASVKMKPRLTEGTLRVLPTLSGTQVDGESLRITLREGERVIAIADPSLSIKIPNVKTWSPDSPSLYDITMELVASDGTLLDKVESVAAMREFGVHRDADGHLRLTLNGEPIFHYGPLDQGWWPDGLLTPPSDEAMRFDVDFLKAAGFNMIRKHIKVEPRRFYDYCDRIGMLVWQDMPSTGGRPEWTRMKPGPTPNQFPPEMEWPAQRHEQFMAEMKSMVLGLQNHASVAMWVPFNERWGQHATIDVGRWLENIDVRRPINIASGGNFFPVGDIADHHNYPNPEFPFYDSRFDDYVKVVGEFGGHGLVVSGHQWNPDMRNWGYGDLPKTSQEYEQRYRQTAVMLGELRQQGIAAGVYTQTTDVEGEVNGLMTYDRAVQKLSPEKLTQIHREAGLIN